MVRVLPVPPEVKKKQLAELDDTKASQVCRQALSACCSLNVLVARTPCTVRSMRLLAHGAVSHAPL